MKGRERRTTEHEVGGLTAFHDFVEDGGPGEFVDVVIGEWGGFG